MVGEGGGARLGVGIEGGRAYGRTTKAGRGSQERLLMRRTVGIRVESVRESVGGDMGIG